MLVAAFVASVVLAFSCLLSEKIEFSGAQFHQSPKPTVNSFSLATLGDMPNGCVKLVVVRDVYFQGFENFLLNQEFIGKACRENKLEIFLEEFHAGNYGNSDCFFQQFGYHKEPIVVVFTKGRNPAVFDWPDFTKDQILNNTREILDSIETPRSFDWWLALQKFFRNE